MEEYVAKCLTPLYRFKWLMTTLTDECYNDLEGVIRLYIATTDNRLWLI